MDHYRRSLRNTFVNEFVDRMAERRADSEWLAQLMEASQTRFMPIWRSQCLIVPGPEDTDEYAAVELDRQQASWLIEVASDVVFLGTSGEQGARFALNLSNDNEAVEPQTAAYGSFEDLRVASRRLGEPQAGLLAYAKALTDWQDRHRFCGHCGNPTTTQSAGHVLRCSDAACGRQHFPRLDPAVIVSVTYQDAILLGRQAVWPEGQYSVVAGFVEAGESLEQAVKREVMEETGIVIDRVSYHSSQPWPFPNSVMLGFDARAVSDKITLNDNELEHAKWMTREEIIQALVNKTLRLPSFVSISYRLIEDWFDDNEKDLVLQQVLAETGGHQWRHPKSE